MVATQVLGGFITYEGDVAGDTIHTVPRSTFTCTQTDHWVGHMVLSIQFDGDRVSKGAPKIKSGSNTGTASTCPNDTLGTGPFPFGNNDGLHGTKSALSAEGTDSGSWGSIVIDFQGSLDGDTITGSLTINETYINPPPGKNITGFGVIPVTLQRTSQ